MDVRDAALLFRSPDEFETLLSALEADEGLSMRDKLDGALKTIAKSNYKPTQMERNLALELAATYDELADHNGDDMENSRYKRSAELRSLYNA